MTLGKQKIKKITELKELNNNSVIDELTDQQRHEWYIQIKDSLPKLRLIMDTQRIESAIADYEKRIGVGS
jgi:hypothetical protein